MITVALASSVVVLGAAMLLIAAGIGHSRRPGEFAASVRRHGVASRRLIRTAAPLVGPLEVVVGVGTTAIWALGLPGPAFGLAATTVILVYLGFGLYALEASRSAPGSPCGCFGAGEPLTWAVPARAFVLALASVPALSSPPPPVGARPGALAAAVLVALLAWAVPVVVALTGDVGITARQSPRRS